MLAPSGGGRSRCSTSAGRARLHELRALIESCTFIPIVYLDYDSASRGYAQLKLRKIDVAGYIEASRIGYIVLKVIPLCNPARKLNANTIREWENTEDVLLSRDAVDCARSR